MEIFLDSRDDPHGLVLARERARDLAQDWVHGREAQAQEREARAYEREARAYEREVRPHG